MENQKCPRCGGKVQRNYCMKCGLIVENGKNYQIVNHWNEENELELFIGDKATQFMHQPSNLAAAFFGLPYFFYRKCFAIGFLFTIVEYPILVLITKYLDQYYFFVFYFCLFFIHGAFFNPLYLRFAQRRLIYLKQHAYSSEQIFLKGQPSIIYSIIYILLLVFVSILCWLFL